MILNPLWNSHFGLGGGTPQLHHLMRLRVAFDYGADIDSTDDQRQIG